MLLKVIVDGEYIAEAVQLSLVWGEFENDIYCGGL